MKRVFYVTLFEMAPRCMLTGLAAVLAGALTCGAQTVTALHSGDWNNPSTWVGGLPSSGNTADIGTFTIAVNANFTVGGLTVGPNGTLTGNNGALTVLNQISLNPLSSNASEHLVGGLSNTTITLNNAGTANLNAPVGVQVGLTDDNAGTALLNNLSGGTFNLNSSASILGNATSVFTNQSGGTLNHTGNGTSAIQWTFSNNGTVEVGNGTLDLQGPVTQVTGGTLTGGTWNVRSSGNIVLPGSLTTIGTGANVTLDGASSAFAALDSLATVNGTFSIVNGRTFTSSGNFDDNGSLVINGTGSTLGTNGSRLNIAEASNSVATLTISNGGNISSGEGDIANGFNSSGIVTVTGANSKWSAGASNLFVGGFGTANLTIADGGAVNATNVQIAGFGVGSLLVTGPNSTLTTPGDLNPGFGGTASLTVANGATVSSGYALLAFASDSNANVLVSDAGSTWSYGSSMAVGGSGNGTLTIANGGKATGGQITLATDAGINGTLNLNTQGTLEVGGADGLRAGAGNYAFNWGGGTLKLTSDFTTSINATLVPDATPSAFNTNGFNATWAGVISGSDSFAKIGNGTLTFTGNNTYSGLTTIVTGNLQVGNGGNTGALGTSDAHNFGNLVFNRANTYTFAGNISGSGNLYQEGAGTLILSGNNTYTGETRIDEGTLQLVDVGAGSALGTSTVFVTANGTLTGGGIIGGNVVVTGAVNPGVGNTTDLITVAGGLAFNPGAVVTMNLNGTVREVQYDAIDVDLDILYHGTLNVLLVDSYSPSKGNYFDLFNVGGAGAGNFAAVNLPTLPGFLEWDTTQLYTNGRLAVIPEPGAFAALFGAVVLALCVCRRRKTSCG